MVLLAGTMVEPVRTPTRMLGQPKQTGRKRVAEGFWGGHSKHVQCVLVGNSVPLYDVVRREVMAGG